MNDSRLLKEIRCVITDIDGVLTDGGMYYSEQGDELKRFNVRDGAGIVLLKHAGILVGGMTGEAVTLNVRRFQKMGADFLFTGVRNKERCLRDLMAERGLQSSQIAYVGDEINDLPMVGKVGMLFAVGDACTALRRQAHQVLSTSGGGGVLRELAEIILRGQGRYEESLRNYTNSLMEFESSPYGGGVSHCLNHAGSVCNEVRS